MRSELTLTCARCGAQFHEDDAAGLCPRCLLSSARLRGAEKLPRPFGRFTLLEPCGEGGMGVVYRAWDPSAERVVALKMLRTRELASDAEVKRFLDEARRASSLRHEHIARVLEVGAEGGVAYFTMDFVDGPTLAEEMPALRADPRAAARLVRTLALAVHHAHQRMILHRDLKPANVLLEDGEPRLVDFGIARRLDGAADTRTGDVAGTLPYMAPEQLEGQKELTSEVDVYGLGAVLFELLCGRPPVEGSSPSEVLRARRVRPREIDARIDPDLERICLKCLEPQPQDRYASAAGLAADLARFLEGEAVLARPLARHERALRVIRRNPLPALVVVGALVLLVTTALVALSVAREQERELRAEVLETNAFAARALSGAVLLELRTLADALEKKTQEPALVALLGTPDDPAVTDAWRTDTSAAPFDSLFVLDAAGVGRARIPEEGPKLIGKSFAWRDYFVGAARFAQRGARGAHVSRAYISQQTGTTRFSLSVPVYGADGAWLGVLEGAIESGERLGRLAADEVRDGKRRVVVVARRDRESADAPLPDDGFVLFHDDVAHGRQHVMSAHAFAGLPRPEGAQLEAWRAPALALDDYRDPVEGGDAVWLAAAAPVGATPFAVFVQTRTTDAVAATQQLGPRLARAMAPALLIGAVLVLTAFAGIRRRAR